MLRCILDRLPYIGHLRKRVKDVGLYPAGHYYSPIPKHEEILVYLESTKTEETELPGIDLNRLNQLELLTAFQAFYKDLPFSEEKIRNAATTIIRVFSATQMLFFSAVS